MEEEWLYIFKIVFYLERKDDVCVGQVEIIWVQIPLPYHLPMLVGCVCRPPNLSNMSYLEDLCCSIDKATEGNLEVLLLGDFNINWSDTKNTNRIK